MPTISKETALTLERLNSKARWKARGSLCICEIVGFNGKPYAMASAATDDEALLLAVAEAEKIGPPLTPDQAASKYGSLVTQVQAKDAEIADLRRQLAEQSAPPAATPDQAASNPEPKIPDALPPKVETPQIPQIPTGGSSSPPPPRGGNRHKHS